MFNLSFEIIKSIIIKAWSNIKLEQLGNNLAPTSVIAFTNYSTIKMYEHQTYLLSYEPPPTWARYMEDPTSIQNHITIPIYCEHICY
jgi:hypothetical protein